MKLNNASLVLDGASVSQEDLDRQLTLQGGCSVRPRLLTGIPDEGDAIAKWLAAKRRTTVLAWLTEVPLEIQGLTGHCEFSVECGLWADGRSGEVISCALRLVQTDHTDIVWVKTLPATVAGESVATRDGVLYAMPGLSLHIAFSSDSALATVPIDRPATDWVPHPIAMVD